MTEESVYLPPHKHGRWSIGVHVDGRTIRLVQDTFMEHPKDAIAILKALDIPITKGNLDHYFPVISGEGRCPKLELMERCKVLDPFYNPVPKHQTGV